MVSKLIRAFACQARIAAKAFSERTTLPRAPSLMIRIAGSGMAVDWMARVTSNSRRRRVLAEGRYLRRSSYHVMRLTCFKKRNGFVRAIPASLLAV